MLISVYGSDINDQIEFPAGADFYKFYLSSQNLLQNKPIYWSAPDRNSPTSHCNPELQPKFDQKLLEAMPDEIRYCLHPNLNPPIFVALTAPLALLDFPRAWWAWSIVSILCGIWALTLIFKTEIFASASTPTKTLIGVGFFCYYPTFANTALGQVTLFLFLILTLAWLALRNGSQLQAGCWLGAAASIKPFFGLFLIALLISKNWRASAAFIGICAISFLLGGWATGFSAYPHYVSILNDIYWLASSWNGSFTGFFTRLFGSSGNKVWIEAPMLGRGLSTVCSLTTLVTLAAVIRKQPKTDQKFNADTLVALTITAMLLISPLGWIYYFPMLFISFIVIWNLSATLENGRTYKLLLILFTIPTIPPRPLISIYMLNSPRIWFWDAGVYFYLLLFTFSLIAILSVQINRKNLTDPVLNNDDRDQ